jgi:diguanylate cyclase (GGDEF)-like protein
VGSKLTKSKANVWARLKWHFTESFAGELLYRRRDEDQDERVDDLRDKRRRHAYRYILIILSLILVPIVAHNIYIRQMVPAVATLLVLGALIVNILLLSFDREAFLSIPVVLLLNLTLVMLSLFYGQNYSLFLLFPLLVSLPVLLRPRWAVCMGALTGILVLPVVLNQYDPTTAAAVSISMVLTWIVSAWLVFAMTEQSRRLRGMAITDSLTGAFNRRYLELQAVKCLRDWDRYQRPASILLVDVDHFKSVNDKFGHAVGDSALTNLVDLVQQRLRKADIVCRFGGEEFVLLLSETDREQAGRVAEELRGVVESAQTLPNGKMTISVGVSDVTQAMDMDHWFKLADSALYKAKRKGRNRVELATLIADSEPAVAPLASTVPLWR